MAFSTQRTYGGINSKAPAMAVEPSRGAAGAPGAASIPAAGQGGSPANDVAGVLGIGGGMLGKFLYDKYKDDPEGLKQMLGLAPDLSGNIGIPEGTMLAGVQPDPNATLGGQVGGLAGMPVQNTAMPAMAPGDPNAAIGGDIGFTGSNFGAGVPVNGIQPYAVTDYLQQMGISPYIGG